MLETFDFQQFHSRLRTASQTVFEALLRDNPDETFYAFGLFHEPLWGYIIPTANTEEGLLRRAQEYKLDPYNQGYAQMSLDALMIELRWSPADWAYHEVGVDSFQPVNDWLTEHDIYDFVSDAGDELYTELHERMVSVCRDVLKALDAVGTFGQGKARERIVLNIMMGDQDASWIAHARALNPPNVYDRWIAEVRQAGLL